MYVQTPWLQNKEQLSIQIYDESTDSWKALMEPSGMEWSVYDLDAGGSTGRDLTGGMLRDRVAIKEKIMLTFPPMEVEDFTTMLSLTSPQFFQCRYYSMKTGGMRQVEMYVGDRSAKWYNGKKNVPSDKITDVTFNFIER